MSIKSLKFNNYQSKFLNFKIFNKTKKNPKFIKSKIFKK